MDCTTLSTQTTNKVLLLAFALSIPGEYPLSDPAQIRAAVPGLIVVPEFITVDEGTAIMSFVDRDESAWTNLSNRRVRHFGYKFK